MKTKEFILTTIFIITLLIIYILFPVKNIFQQLIVMITFFVIIPVIFNKVILKKEFKELGLKLGEWKEGLLWGGISIVLMGIIFFIMIYFFNFLKHYSVPAFIVSDYKKFLFYEFALVFPVIFIYDLFFRGFIMLYLKDKIYYWAIIIQAMLFFILVIATGSFSWILSPYLVSVLLAGIIVYKSQSLIYSTITQFIVIVILNASIVHFIR